MKGYPKLPHTPARGKLRETLHHPAPDALERFVRAIADALAAGATAEQIRAAIQSAGVSSC